MNNIRANIKDYSCTMVKRERINGKLNDQEFMYLQVRHEPFSVYMYFLGPEKLKGQEALYVAGKNNGNLLGHGVGIRKIAGTVPLQPTGAILEVKRPDVVVGRHSGADVRLSLPDISRRHCRLFYADGRWEVNDLDSLNGVWVNEEAVEQAVLNQGDTIRIGGFTFKIDLSKPATAADDARDGVLRSIFSALPPPEEDSQQSRRRAS